MASYGTSQVADLLGVSADTIRRWGDEGRLTLERGEGGHLSVDGRELARYLSEQAHAYEPDSVMAQSARNRFTGIITRVERDSAAIVSYTGAVKELLAEIEADKRALIAKYRGA